jgi:pyruvate dehydrogenase E2 component (dihydrolipoamide acetyltransferase)
VAARIAAEHNIDLSRVKPQQGKRIQKADVLAYLETQKDRKGEPAMPVQASRPLASPKARRLAAEHGLELSDLEGRGPEGAVLAADVLTAASGSGAAGGPAPQTAEPTLPPAAALQTLSLSRVERIAAERLSQSWATVPHFYIIREVQAGKLITWRTQAQSRSSEKITLTDLLVKVIAVALSRHPRLNARWDEDSIILNPDINVGLAVAVESGLVVPVIHRADTLGLIELAARRKALVEKVRSAALSPTDLNGGTFTVSNLGMYGVDAFNAIINPLRQPFWLSAG